MPVGPRMSSFLLCKVWHYESICPSVGGNQNQLCFRDVLPLVASEGFCHCCALKPKEWNLRRKHYHPLPLLGQYKLYNMNVCK